MRRRRATNDTEANRRPAHERGRPRSTRGEGSGQGEGQAAQAQAGAARRAGERLYRDRRCRGVERSQAAPPVRSPVSSRAAGSRAKREPERRHRAAQRAAQLIESPEVAYVELGEAMAAPRRSSPPTTLREPAGDGSSSAAAEERGAHRHHRRPGLRLRPRGLPRRARQDALRAHLGPGRRRTPGPRSRPRECSTRRFDYGAEFTQGRT